jgi:hypothetical protein
VCPETSFETLALDERRAGVRFYVTAQQEGWCRYDFDNVRNRAARSTSVNECVVDGAESLRELEVMLHRGDCMDSAWIVVKGVAVGIVAVVMFIALQFFSGGAVIFTNCLHLDARGRL